MITFNFVKIQWPQISLLWQFFPDIFSVRYLFKPKATTLMLMGNIMKSYYPMKMY